MRRLLALAAPLFVLACAAPSSGRVRLVGADGVTLQQATLREGPDGVELAARLASAGGFSNARRAVVVTAVAVDGARTATARTTLELVPYDRVPSRRARTATLAATLPAAATFDHLEIALAPGH